MEETKTHVIKLNDLEIRYAINDWLFKLKGDYIKNHSGNMKNPCIAFEFKKNLTNVGDDPMLFATCVMETKVDEEKD